MQPEAESDVHSSSPAPAKIERVLAVLLGASHYAGDVHCEMWDFAVEIARLKRLGASLCDLRWLVMKGLVEHGREVTTHGDDHRVFRPSGRLFFSKRTCFVLSEAGISFAQRVRGRESNEMLVDFPGGVGPGGNGASHHHGCRLVPTWDAERHELRVNGTLVKQFKWPATNQEVVLAAFEEDGWPAKIDDPLPPQPGQDPKRRLHDTIKCLNRKQQKRLIRFHGDGTGEGVRWGFVEANGGN